MSRYAKTYETRNGVKLRVEDYIRVCDRPKQHAGGNGASGGDFQAQDEDVPF